MTDVIWRIHRLRKVEEHRARLELAEAEFEERRRESALDKVVDDVRDSREQTKMNDAHDVAQHHNFALRMEMTRRMRELELSEQRDVVVGHRDDVRGKALEAKVVEMVGDAREEAEAAERRRGEQKELDEAGAQAWWRKLG
jgi:flagellar export protein FliJ